MIKIIKISRLDKIIYKKKIMLTIATNYIRVAKESRKK